MMDLKPFGTILVALLVLDVAYLYARYNYHSTFFYSIQKSPLTVNYAAAGLVYLLLAVALYFGAYARSKSLKTAALYGAIVGFILYGFYDATNMATLANWTWEMVAVDTLWGTVAGASAVASAFALLH